MTPTPLPGYRSPVYATQDEALAALREMPGGSRVMVPNERWGFIEYSKGYDTPSVARITPAISEVESV